MLARGVPASLLLHAVAFAAMLLWGNLVGRPQVRTPSAISVRLVGSPGGGRSAPETAAPEPQAAPAEPAPRPDPVRPPKEVPRERAKDKPKQASPELPETGPKTKATAAGSGRPASAGSGSGSSGVNGASVGVGGPSVSGTDSDFPFAYYVQAVEGRIVANWHPRQLGFGDRAVVSCSVHFVIGRGGAVSQVRLVRNSGLGVFDREAVRAVQTSRLPPLPPQYRGSDLGVTFDFNLEPGSQ
jgi:TonB family protein